MIPITWDVLVAYAVPVLLLAAAATLFAAWVSWRGDRGRTDMLAEPLVRANPPNGPSAGQIARPEANARRVLWAIRAAVLVWGAVLAVGAYRLNHNPWRTVMVLACVLAFLGLWSWLTAAARRRRHGLGTASQVTSKGPPQPAAGPGTNRPV
jgi:hypothetical protein